MDQNQSVEHTDSAAVKEMLAGSGYSEKAIEYYLQKEYMGDLPDADQVSEMIGSCGDTMKVFLKVGQSQIQDIRYQVLGCPGAIASAMAAATLIRGKSLDHARTINDNDIFKELEEIPAKKHHCIQLAVKTLHKAIDEYGNENPQDR
ncbi:MAG: iron-sulfur cluster assembly scaffold protein [Desulfobacteraceae bacterium]|nr:iron-sulfur cluster assembly scaffold protein [Desulfobacteraceae bacterium]